MAESDDVETFAIMKAEFEDCAQICDLQSAVWGANSTYSQFRTTINYIENKKDNSDGAYRWTMKMVSSRLVDDGDQFHGEPLIIAVAVWEVCSHSAENAPQGYLDLIKSRSIQDLSSEINRIWGDAETYEFNKSIAKSARLKCLSALPLYQRRGLGGALLQYCLEGIDELGFPCYLSSSFLAKTLYAKHGFQRLVPGGDSNQVDFAEDKQVIGISSVMARPVPLTREDLQRTWQDCCRILDNLTTRVKKVHAAKGSEQVIRSNDRRHNTRIQTLM